MPGTAGSKYGISNDSVPLRKSKNGKHTNLQSDDTRQPEIDLTDLRSLINARIENKQIAQHKP